MPKIHVETTYDQEIRKYVVKHLCEECMTTFSTDAPQGEIGIMKVAFERKMREHNRTHK